MIDLTWDLTFLYKGLNDPFFNADFEKTHSLCKEACSLPDKTDTDLHKLRRMVDIKSELEETFLKVYAYVMVTLCADNYNQEALRKQGDITRLETEVNRANAALVRYVGKIQDLEALIASDPELGKVSFHLREMKQQSLHQYPEAAEGIIFEMQQNGSLAFSQLRDRLTGTLTASFEGKDLPLPAIRGMAGDADPEVRRKAYLAELACYPKIETAMAYCLGCIKGDALTRYRAMGYSDILEAMLAQSRMSRDTLDAMWKAVYEELPTFRRYLRTKGKLLGHDNGLPFYDLFAPVGSESKTYTLEEAHNLLVNVFTNIDPEIGAFIDHAFNHRWIDFLPREGKEGGAFCEGFHADKRSIVLTNFMGAYDDVSTIAHELGHGWHNHCLENMPVLLCDVPMPLAETASIFNETLLINYMLEHCDDASRLSLLNNTLLSTTQTVVDILSRFIFEKGVFELCKTHIPTADELNRLMLDAQQQAYGDGLDAEIRHPGMWICKSHYYGTDLHFYNFPYCFGLLFGLGVYSRYIKEGASFLPKYNYMLSQCGNGSIAEIAAMVGIDVNSVDYWRSALAVIRSQVDEFCTLAQKKICNA